MALVKLYDKKGQEFEFETVLRKVFIDVPHVNKKEVETVVYVPVEKPTVRFNLTERNTTKYNVVEQTTVKYNVVEKEIEKPVLKPKVYDVPDEKSVKTIKESAGLISEVLNTLPTLIKNLQSVIEMAREVPGVLKRFNEMRELIKNYQVPDFKHVEVIVPHLKDEVIARPVFKDVEVIKPIFREKPMSVEEFQRTFKTDKG